MPCLPQREGRGDQRLQITTRAARGNDEEPAHVTALARG